MRVISSVAGLPADPLLRWAAQAPLRAWSSDDGTAFAVAGAGLSLRDRLAVCGPPDALVPLVREVLSLVGPTFRPFGPRPAVAALVASLPEIRPAGDFGWMDRTAPSPVPPPPAPPPRPAPAAAEGPARATAAWLSADDEPEIAALLLAGHPSSYATPGVPGVQRWAGVRDGAGRLTAVAAQAWSAPSVGFLAGIAVCPAARGRGLGREVCRFVLAESLATYGTAALMVDDDNVAAIALYRTLGLTYRPVSAASVGG